MKLLLAFSFLLFFSITGYPQKTITPAKIGTTYGKKIKTTNTINRSELTLKLTHQKEFRGKIEGKVTEVCRKKGCFMNLKQETGEPIVVFFKDYALFMPQDIVGRTVVVEGTAVRKETSVEQLLHFAQDAGKSNTEILKITKPKLEVEITADGVLVVK
ncbi:DUF4920 domain-containing protein [Rufibacter tibetensis]|uniref:DUF4920 domain-containing protein n=1 Tax=Rufibacter tibetensis TaxID=512763 RepID=A0A0P0C738_9BACT|nr:DUF4920 domain-containing protein [Rufibacter tibetensis]ALJ00845.1 hypothetical protein DC20_19940 [Rufibacter tibetensis]